MNCPNCNSPVPEGAAFCGVCGKSLKDVATNAEPVAETPVENVPEVADVVSEAPVESISESSNVVVGTLPQVGETPKPENDVAEQIKDGFQNVTKAVQEDTQEAVAAVKNGKFGELLKNKTFLICCGAIVAVILLVIIIACCAAMGSSNDKVKGSYYMVDDGSNTVFFYNGKLIK